MMKSGHFDAVFGLIEKWNPKRYKSHNKHRDDLLEYLEDNLQTNQGFGFGLTNGKKPLIRKETRRSYADISVDRDDVGIEVKYNFRGKSKVDRLQGQISNYIDDFNDVIVVFVGSNTSKDSIKYAHHLFSKINTDSNSNMGMYTNRSKRIKIIDKTKNKKTTGRKEKPRNNSGIDFSYKPPDFKL